MEHTTAVRRILVVEDNLDCAVSTVMLLRDMGHEVASALNVGAALAEARTFRPEVVLLDLGLPDGCGWDVARTLKAENAKVRVIVMTARATEADRLRSAAAGCEAHLVKPVDPQRLGLLLGL